jgi:precorrin-8X/cobalt-precorrin-8 methylmutase
MKLEHIRPEDIERRSMELIEAELSAPLPPDTAPVVKRVIHTTADFDYARNLVFSPGAVERGRAALEQGCTVVTDTTMAQSGINKRALSRLGGRTECFISHPEVVRLARERCCTRSAAAVDYAAETLTGPLLFAIGNAPTALLRLCELTEAGMLRPELVIGVPVGFVNVTESKERALAACIKYAVPAILAMGRKGGSTVAAAILNALLYQAADLNAPESRLG